MIGLNDFVVDFSFFLLMAFGFLYFPKFTTPKLEIVNTKLIF